MTAASARCSPAVFAASWNSGFGRIFWVFIQPSCMAFWICRASGAPSFFPLSTVSVLTCCGIVMVWYSFLRRWRAFAFARWISGPALLVAWGEDVSDFIL